MPPQFPASDYQLGWRVYLVLYLVYKYSLAWTVETNPRVKQKQTKGIPGLEDHAAQKVPQMSGCNYSRGSEGEALTGFETQSHSCWASNVACCQQTRVYGLSVSSTGLEATWGRVLFLSCALDMTTANKSLLKE